MRGRSEEEQQERLRCTSEKPCFKMPAHTKEQVFGGLRFQAGRADGITRILTFVDNKEEPVHGRHVNSKKKNMPKRIRH